MLSLRWHLTLLASLGTVLFAALLLAASFQPHVRVWGMLAFAVLLLYFMARSIRLPGGVGVHGTRLMLPLVLLWGKVFGLGLDDIRRQMIAINNRNVARRLRGRHIKNVLILFPHCLQWWECSYKITTDVDNCRECGKCGIPAIRAAAKKHGLKVMVVTGGTEARRQIKQSQSDLIVACACERDLLGGIFDVRQSPVFGILNRRPNGSCRSTNIDINELVGILDRAMTGTL
mgnify:CR=1 FL=1